MTDRERIVEEVLAVLVKSGGRGRLYEFTADQEQALKALGLPMVPVKERYIIDGVLQDLEAAGYAWYRPDEHRLMRILEPDERPERYPTVGGDS